MITTVVRSTSGQNPGRRCETQGTYNFAAVDQLALVAPEERHLPERLLEPGLRSCLVVYITRISHASRICKGEVIRTDERLPLAGSPGVASELLR